MSTNGGNGSGSSTPSPDNAAEFAETSSEDLIRSGPMTPARAELEGETDVDFGPNCDTYVTTPGADDIGDSFMIYDWAYDRDPPSNIYAVPGPPVRSIFTAIQLAGPDLTPDSFRDALFRTEPTGGGPTRPLIAFGDNERWGDFDLGSIDDVSLIWWDQAAEGEDELGLMGAGLYRYASGGQRYSVGELPDSPEEAGLFDAATGVLQLDELPSEDRPPDYPAPQL